MEVHRSKGGFVHFGDFLELSGPVVAADLTDRQCWVQELHEALGVQLQVAEQRLHTWSGARISWVLPSFSPVKRQRVICDWRFYLPPSCPKPPPFPGWGRLVRECDTLAGGASGRPRLPEPPSDGRPLGLPQQERLGSAANTHVQASQQFLIGRCLLITCEGGGAGLTGVVLRPRSHTSITSSISESSISFTHTQMLVEGPSS